MTIGDMVADVIVEIHARRSRALLMTVAVALSTGALIASNGISGTAAKQIDADLAASTLDLVTVSVAPAYASEHPAAGDGGASELPADVELRARQIDLVVAAGRRLDVTGLTSPTISRTVEGQRQVGEDHGVVLTGVSPGYLDAAEIHATAGRDWLLAQDMAVAFIGSGAAENLNVPSVGDLTGVTIWINGEKYAVAGTIGNDRSSDLDNAVVIPYQRAVAYVGGDGETTVLVRTAPGAGAPVASVIRSALRPDAPERLLSSQVVGVESLRAGVSTQLARLTGWIGSFLLALTVLLIANAMIVSVMARIPEIGLRRALGSSRRAVAGVFLMEGALTGLLGGLAGSALGAVVVVVVAIASQWSVAFQPWSLVLGPILGASVGIAASVYPALRASRIRPAVAVRSD